MKNVLYILILLNSILVLSSCANNEIVDNAHPYADIADGFMTQEPRTFREDRYRPNEFFFKHCEQEFGETHYSRTAYFCNDR